VGARASLATGCVADSTALRARRPLGCAMRQGKALDDQTSRRRRAAADARRAQPARHELDVTREGRGGTPCWRWLPHVSSSRPVPAVFMHNKQRESLNLNQALCDDVLRLGN
jgi:hypothetical protein